MQSDIDAMTNPTGGSSGTSKITGNTRARAGIPLIEVIFAKAIVKSYEPGRQDDRHDVARVMALTVAWQQIGGEPDTD